MHARSTRGVGKQSPPRPLAARYDEQKRVNLKIGNSEMKCAVEHCNFFARAFWGPPVPCSARTSSLLCKLVQLCQLYDLMTANKHRFAEVLPKVFALPSKSSSAIGLVVGNEQSQCKIVNYVKTN